MVHTHEGKYVFFGGKNPFRAVKYASLPRNNQTHHIDEVWLPGPGHALENLFVKFIMITICLFTKFESFTIFYKIILYKIAFYIFVLLS